LKTSDKFILLKPFKTRWLSLQIFLLACLLPELLLAQGVKDEVPYYGFGEELSLMPSDSAVLLNIRFRVQNRVTLESGENNLSRIEEIGARVERLRLRLDGFVFDSNFVYIMELAFSRNDLDGAFPDQPDIPRDIMVFYRFSDHFTLGLGRTTIPGNRQRLISSGDLQLVERSLVNNTFEIENEFGLFAYFFRRLTKGKEIFIGGRGAITSGWGREPGRTQGTSYAARIEILPLGRFKDFGDYFEGDLEKEPFPRLSLSAGTIQKFNNIQTGQGNGFFLYEPRNVSTYMADLLFKYEGFSLSIEYLNRFVKDPITFSDEGEVSYAYTGYGGFVQAGYLLDSNWEFVGRYSMVQPLRSIRLMEGKQQEFTMGINKYLKGHRLKLSSDVSYLTNTYLGPFSFHNWRLRFQIELGI
jgi:phosphate-selective porin OprO and OprP